MMWVEPPKTYDQILPPTQNIAYKMFDLVENFSFNILHDSAQCFFNVLPVYPK